ncbi:hypothetical protein F0L17_08685 [Streptomyces sp. TRM43335]|uniref:Sortase n=1 Tax=Streptomyces taklimakanensis TaxID=2569853 RepID=A0A6G2BAA3_9ACTN|nr:hypothetical protein [Streptomyces taklimakanensis]MTE19201.1 hypothetical protein [Streptomyces taklimakanensis]
MGIFRTARPAPRVRTVALTVLAAVLSAAPAAAVPSPDPGAGPSRSADARTAEGGARGTDAEVELRVTPARARPGAEIELRLPSCGGAVVTARSEAFVTDALLSPAPGGGLRGEAVVRSDAEEKDHGITVECAGVRVTGRVTVHRGASGSGSPPPPPHGEDHPSAHGTLPPTGPAESPVAPVPAGGGGAAGEAPGGAGAGSAEDTSDAGPGALHTALGLGLAGTVTLIAVRRAVLQRRRAAEGTDGGDG